MLLVIFGVFVVINVGLAVEHSIVTKSCWFHHQHWFDVEHSKNLVADVVDVVVGICETNHPTLLTLKLMLLMLLLVLSLMLTVRLAAVGDVASACLAATDCEYASKLLTLFPVLTVRCVAVGDAACETSSPSSLLTPKPLLLLRKAALLLLTLRLATAGEASRDENDRSRDDGDNSRRIGAGETLLLLLLENPLLPALLLLTPTSVRLVAVGDKDFVGVLCLETSFAFFS
eukprot:c27079_g1_i1.p1 GENE.c27079_g1_i1~~c27079_g1_i1.p1  ORF type:complete len:230 (+),score=54.55 c27079_g1_i1:180-869(+)